MMNQELIQALANELLQAEDTATPIPPLTDRYPEMTIDDAYAVQKVGGRLDVGQDRLFPL